MYYRDKNGNKIDGKMVIKENYENKDIIKIIANIIGPISVGLLIYLLLYPTLILILKLNLNEKTYEVLRVLITLIITGLFFYIMFTHNY
jgi:hypothetical protein